MITMNKQLSCARREFAMNESTPLPTFLDVAKILIQYEYGDNEDLLREFINHCIDVKQHFEEDEVSIGDAFRSFRAHLIQSCENPSPTHCNQTKEILMFEIALMSKRYLLTSAYGEKHCLDAHVSDYVDYHIQSKHVSLDGLGTFGRSSSISSKLDSAQPVEIESTAVLQSDALKLTQSHTIVTSHLIPLPQQPAVLDLISPMPATSTSTAINPDYNSILSILQASAAHYPSHCNLEKPTKWLDFDWAAYEEVTSDLKEVAKESGNKRAFGGFSKGLGKYYSSHHHVSKSCDTDNNSGTNGFKPTVWSLPSVTDATVDNFPVVTSRDMLFLFAAPTGKGFGGPGSIGSEGSGSSRSRSCSVESVATFFAGVENADWSDVQSESGQDALEHFRYLDASSLPIAKRRRSSEGVSILRSKPPSSDSGESLSSTTLRVFGDDLSIDDFDRVWDGN
jgi:hypothetical protein